MLVLLCSKQQTPSKWLIKRLVGLEGVMICWQAKQLAGRIKKALLLTKRPVIMVDVRGPDDRVYWRKAISATGQKLQVKWVVSPRNKV